MCLKNDKEYIIGLLERELKKSKEKEKNNKHDYIRRIELLKKVIDFIKNG